MDKPLTVKPIVRRAVPDDTTAIIGLLTAANDLRTTAEDLATYLANPTPIERAFVAELEQQVVGMACLRIMPQCCDPHPYAELTELLVAEPFRRSGVGRALVGHIEAEAVAAGATELLLMTAWRNSRAHTFYHAVGYSLYTLMMRKRV